MIDENKTRSQLIKELHEMQKRIAVLESNCNKEYQAGKTNYEAYEIINNSSMAVIEWRNEEGWPVDFTTDNVENILGYCQDRMLSGHFRYDRIIHPDDLARVQHEVAKFSNEKKCERFVHKPYRILTPKGEERWIEDRTCIGRDEKGNVTHYRGIILDITDRKQAEETAAQFGQILDDSLNEIYIFDVVTLKFIQVNHGAQKNLGYSIEEIKELTPIDIKPEFTLSVFTDIAKPLVSGKKKQVIFETVHKRKNGSTYPVEVHLQISTFNSKPVYVAIILDITKRKQMAEVLEKRIVALTQPLEDVENITFEDLFELSDIQRLQDLYAEAFGVAALITHPDGTPITEQSNFTTLCGEIIRNTPKGVKNCNYSDSMIGKHNPAGPTIQPCLSAGLCNAGASITVGGRHIANWLIGQVRNEAQKEEEIMPYAREIGVDEEAFRAAYRKVPTMSEEQFERVANVLFDVTKQLSMSAYQNVQQARFITQHKRDEEELRQLRNYLSNIIDSMPSILVAVDTDGNVTQWNKQTEKNTGLSFGDARAQPLAKVFPSLADEMEYVKESIKQRRVIRNSKIERREEQDIRFEDVTIFPLVANGVEGAVIRVDDVTEQVRLEEMMVQSEKMLSVGGLAAGMAHEINNPLAGMMQTAEVMADRLGGKLKILTNQKAAEEAGTTIEAVEHFMEARGIPRMLKTITDSGKRVAAIVNNMLSFARKSEATVSSHCLDPRTAIKD